jgi:hypothetical protein
MTPMNSHDLPEPEWQSRWSLPREQSWVFARWFGAIAFFVVGSVVFYSGYRQFRPPPLRPGEAYCGNAIIGGLIAMVLVAPVVAIVSAFVAAGIGAIVDHLRVDHDVPRF